MTYSKILNHVFLISVALACFTLAGCKEKTEAPAPLPIAEAPQAVAAAFKDAKPDLKKKADGAIAALKDKKWDAALLMLQDLSVLPGLTPQQREAATGSMLAANQELKAAAEKGDAQASELMNARRMSK
jgi:hypothetical protein